MTEIDNLFSKTLESIMENCKIETPSSLNNRVLELKMIRDNLLVEKKARIEEEQRRCKERSYRQIIKELTGTEHGFYENLPEEYQDTVYRINRLFAERYTNITLSSDDINYLHSLYNSDHYLFREINNRNLFVQCTGIIPCATGPQLLLRDPFGSIVSEPVSFVTLDEAEKWIGRMLAITATYVILGGDKLIIRHIKVIGIPFEGNPEITFYKEGEKYA